MWNFLDRLAAHIDVIVALMAFLTLALLSLGVLVAFALFIVSMVGGQGAVGGKG